MDNNITDGQLVQLDGLLNSFKLLNSTLPIVNIGDDDLMVDSVGEASKAVHGECPLEKLNIVHIHSSYV